MNPPQTRKTARDVATKPSFVHRSAGGVTNACQYDVPGRLSTVVAGNVAVAGCGRAVVGNLPSLRYANGVTNLYQYDSRNPIDLT